VPSAEANSPVLQLIAAVAIHLVIPLMGVFTFWKLYRRMRDANIPAPPIIPCFILFFTLGGWLLVVLTGFLWFWSGMASLGVFYLIFVAPLLTAILAWKLRCQRALSVFHQYAFLGCATYPCVIIVGLVGGLNIGFIGR
jgi:hypothetical protein